MMVTLPTISNLMLFIVFSPFLDCTAARAGACLIQQSPLPFGAKRSILSTLVKPGMTREQVVTILGEAHPIYGYGPGNATWIYENYRLSISFSAEGRVWAIATHPRKSLFPEPQEPSWEEIKRILEQSANRP